MRSVDKVPFHVIASDRRKRGNLILHAAQGIEIATARKAHLAMTAPWVYQQALKGGAPDDIRYEPPRTSSLVFLVVFAGLWGFIGATWIA